MASQKRPKVVLFDIGGVCVLSPFQGIIDFERKHRLPTNWINYAIRYSSPNGHWQRLERGEIKMDADFFKGFTADLHNKNAWSDFHTKFRKEKRLKDIANPTQLGDPVSLKAEAADSHPTDDDLGAQPSQPTSQPPSNAQNNEKPSLSKLAKDTTIGDPISLESEEVVETSPPPKSNSISHPQPTEPIVAPSPTKTTSNIPPLPSIDGESLFWTMMSASRSPDPYIFPALQRLHALSPRPILAALSNTVIYPPDHPWSNPDRPSSPSSADTSPFIFNPRTFFDIYIASAEVGMRKPARDIYLHTIHALDAYDKKERRGSGVSGEDIVFLDDIGENLKMGREVGMRTVRVMLGKTWRAVKELERILGVELMDEKTRRAKL
ncbi:hypothetical protein JMJ35_005727 [Cladonia borealis]|uniref:Epoxide hydrolase n=1 Tax=Cladonia borealis TaxID=184061 RepID=A0AA39QZ12_9LECA|nr:hypothetical protein JMJ35_005727 [Cladonia borealis]